MTVLLSARACVPYRAALKKTGLNKLKKSARLPIIRQ